MDLTTPTTRATIRPWVDPLVDRRGHDPRSTYVEKFWLGIIGPSATWIMRRLASEFDDEPTGYTLDLDQTASAMGLSYAKGQHSPFGRALHRCVMFGLVQPSNDGYCVRRRLPTVAQRHLKRLPADVQREHDEWARRPAHLDIHDLEQHLIRAGIPPRTAIRASELAALAS